MRVGVRIHSIMCTHMRCTGARERGTEGPGAWKSLGEQLGPAPHLTDGETEPKQRKGLAPEPAPGRSASQSQRSVGFVRHHSRATQSAGPMDVPASPGRSARPQVSPAPEAAAEKWRNLPVRGAGQSAQARQVAALVEQSGRQGVHVRAWWGLQFTAGLHQAERGRLSLSMGQAWPRMQGQGCQPWACTL